MLNNLRQQNHWLLFEVMGPRLLVESWRRWLSLCLDSRFTTFAFCSFFFFFFFVFTCFWRSAATVQWTVAANVDFFSEQCIRALFTDPQISFFINFFIKNGLHGTIYTFKNYFATVISAISFQFQQNKSYPNRP